MHPFSNALMHEMRRAADIERERERRHRGRHLDDETPAVPPSSALVRLGVVAGAVIQSIRSHTVQRHRPAEPAGS